MRQRQEPEPRQRCGRDRRRPVGGAQRLPPRTVDELAVALEDAKRRTDVGCVLLTGNGPSLRDGRWACCSGGDQRVRGDSGYEHRDEGGDGTRTETADSDRDKGVGRLYILGVQRSIRRMPKPVVAVVPGRSAAGTAYTSSVT